MTKITDENGISFIINTYDHTAEITISKPTTENVFIPRTVKYQSQEYLITKIRERSFKDAKVESITFSEDSQIKEFCDECFDSTLISSITIPNSVTKIGNFVFSWCSKLKTVEISDDSNLNFIGKKNFFVTHVDNLHIPSKLTELKDEWCCDTIDLINLTVSPKNQNFCIYKKKMLIGKHIPTSNDFDDLKFVFRNATKITIPSSIVRISPYSMSFCRQLHTIQFDKNSNLKEIANHAFGNSHIKKFEIPSTIRTIGDHAFMECYDLFTVIFPNDFKIKTLPDNLFFNSGLKQCIVPATVSEIGYSCFSQCNELKFIEFAAEDELIFRNYSLFQCKNLSMLCIGNAKKVVFQRKILDEIPEDCMLLFNTGLIINIL